MREIELSSGFARQLEEERAQKGLCPFCGATATRVVEVMISEKPKQGERRPRGERVASISRRLCAHHAESFYMLLKEPRERGRRQEDGR